MIRFRHVKSSLLVLLTFLLAACGDGEVRYPLTPGLSATVDINGTRHEMYVSKVDGRVAHVSFYQQGTLSNHRKYYRGLFVTEAIDKSFHWINDFDPATVEALFPLQVGGAVRFETSFRVLNQDVTGKMSVTMSVSGQSDLSVGGVSYPVYVIEIHQERRLRRGKTISLDRTAYYAPSLGLTLRTVDREGGRTYTTRVVKLERPRPPGRRNTLGTMVI